MTARLDIGDSKLVSDPYAYYRLLRSESPIVERAGHHGVWLVSTYDDVKVVLAASFARSRPVNQEVPEIFLGTPTELMWRNNLAFLEGSRHSRIRRILNRPLGDFSGHHVDAIVRTAVREALAQALSGVRVDAVTEISTQIPRAVICALLRISRAEFDRMALWTRDFLKIFLPDVVDERSYRLVNDASMRFVVFLSDLVERCAEDPADSLIDHLISHKVAGHLSGDELLATIRGVFTAGFETTAATISALLLAISRSPELLQQLRSDASSLSVAVDEGLRWETPVQVVTRYIEKGMLLGGHRIPEGACLWLLLGSANHDDQVFDEPEVFRLRTNSAHHLAFGGGRHKCAGLGLARVELIGFLQEFSRLAREVKVDESQLERHQNLQFRSIRKLPIEILPTEERCGLG